MKDENGQKNLLSLTGNQKREEIDNCEKYAPSVEWDEVLTKTTCMSKREKFLKS